MTIEINDESYIVGIWFSSNPETGDDWLALIIRDPDNPKAYKGFSRFRYTKGKQTTGFDDEKSFTYFKSDKKHAEDDLIDLMDLSQRTIERGYPEKDKVIIKGDSNKFRELLKDKSWMNMYAAH